MKESGQASCMEEKKRANYGIGRLNRTMNRSLLNSLVLHNISVQLFITCYIDYLLYFPLSSSPYVCSHILKVPFEGSEGSGIVYIWIGGETTQEEAIHAEQMGRTMFEVSQFLLSIY